MTDVPSQRQLTAADDPESLTVGAVLNAAVERFGAQEAYVFHDERLTFAVLGDRVEDWTRGLLSLGVQRGERIAVWMPNCLEWVYTVLAAARIGAVVVPVNTSFRKDEAEYVVGQSEATVLFVGAAGEREAHLFEAATDMADSDSTQVHTVVTRDPVKVPGAVSFDELVERGRAISDSDVQARVDATRADDALFIYYTSGTTGFPKGVVHSHQVLRNMRGVATRLGFTESDTLVLYLPLFHVFASLAGVLAYLMAGARIVLMERFDADLSLDLMERERATVVYGMQPIYHDQLQSLAQRPRNLESVRLCITPAPASFARAVAEHIGPPVSVYGMTETTAMTSLPSPDDDVRLRTETVGYPLDGFEVAVLDTTTGTVSPTGGPGEFVVRGEHLMRGYHLMPELTEASYTNDGWFRTGDLGEVRQDGYLVLHGRIKDIIRVGGENVDPTEIESILAEHPLVGLAAVVAEPHDRLGEVTVAYLELAKPAIETGMPDDFEEQLKAFLAPRVARFKVPRRFYVLDSLPRTGSGKIQKFRLSADD